MKKKARKSPSKASKPKKSPAAKKKATKPKAKAAVKKKAPEKKKKAAPKKVKPAPKKAKPSPQKAKPAPKKVTAASQKKAAPQKRAVRKQDDYDTPSKPEAPVFNFIPEKMDLVRQTLITILWRREALTPDRLKEEALMEIATHFGEEFPMYFEQAIAVLGKYNLIEAVPDKRPLHIRLSQRLDA